MDACKLRGVRTHNLKGIDLSIPFGRITVISGVSGSGKSSLAFDTIYAEGQRRFVDCLATYARQFLERLERPDADYIGHLEPPLALKQAAAVRNARSTVGTMSEIADCLQLLFAYAGEPHCVACGEPLIPESVESAVDRILALYSQDRLCVAAPIARDRLGREGVSGLLRQGYARTIHEGRLSEWPEAWLAARPADLPSDLSVVIDRFTRSSLKRTRLAEAIGAAWHMGQGRTVVYAIDPDGEGARPIETLREGAVCRACGRKGEPPRPPLFSANNPLGACPTCQGFGRLVTIDRDKVVPDPRRTLRNDAILPFRMPSRRGWYRRLMKKAPDAGVRTEIPWSDLTREETDWVFAGDKTFPGVDGLFRKLERKRYRMHIRIFLARFRGYVPCTSCRGTRLRPEALAVTIGEKNLSDLNEMPIRDLRAFCESLRFPGRREARVRPVLREIRSRLRCLDDVGLGYLTLARTVRTLSGGETQRLRLASGMGSSLTRALYVLDEPTVGLHARDASRVLDLLREIARAGNTVVVVEHDPAIVEGADHLIVLGPEGGDAGGELIYEGPPAEFLEREPEFFRTVVPPSQQAPSRRTPPGMRVLPETAADRRNKPIAARGPSLRIVDARANNLRIEQLEIPLAGIAAVSGVSGSGKSTLVEEVIYRNWLRYAGRPVENVGEARSISGFESFEEVVLIGQEPLGRSARSNAVSFVKVLPLLRGLLAATPEARERRLRPRDFSFNVPGGRCETCKGLGTVVLEMHFLPDVEVACEACRGRRFRDDVIEVNYRGRNIQTLLETTADEASRLFRDFEEIARRLRPLQEVGLGYLRLGQPTSTLSGGEAQRLKLASFLAEGARKGRRLVLFDEPTTGLHARDIARLIAAMRALIARGDSVLVVEHHLGFLAQADWIVDLGPGAGDEGGRVVYQGPAGELARRRDSITGRALSAYLRGSGRARRQAGGACL